MTVGQCCPCVGLQGCKARCHQQALKPIDIPHVNVRQKRRIMPHVNARRRTSTRVDVRHDAACCVENAAEIKPVLISALCDARQRALTRVDVWCVNWPLLRAIFNLLRPAG